MTQVSPSVPDVEEKIWEEGMPLDAGTARKISAGTTRSILSGTSTMIECLCFVFG
jgi:hypothetical protein